MSLLHTLHDGPIHGRRVNVLSEHIMKLLPTGASVLDVGCGDGLLASLIGRHRPDVTIAGVDVLRREHTRIPVTVFDGIHLPHADASIDIVLFVDVLHHTDDPMVLLREAKRVARRAVVMKDHSLTGWLAGATLCFMDWVGNARHGVRLPYNYWTDDQWHAACRALGLRVGVWKTNLQMYPWPADLVFGRSLHFIARLEVSGLPV